MKRWKLLSVMALVLSGVLVGAGSAGAIPPPRPPAPYVCSGGNIPTGSYASVIVTGICYVPSGTVTVNGNLTLAPNALLDAVTPAGLETGTPNLLPGFVDVGGNISVGPNAVLLLGCDAAIVCPTASTYPGLSSPGDSVGGSITSLGALAVVVHAVKIGGNATIIGGGGGPAELAGGPQSGECDAGPIPYPWNQDFLALNAFGPGIPAPPYMDYEDNSIGGSLSIVGLQGCWMGALRNQIAGDLFDVHNLQGDPDSNEVVNNVVLGSAICFGNDHVVQFGDSGAAPNEVGGLALGECGFNVYQPDVNSPSGLPAPISVPYSPV